MCYFHADVKQRQYCGQDAASMLVLTTRHLSLPSAVGATGVLGVHSWQSNHLAGIAVMAASSKQQRQCKSLQSSRGRCGNMPSYSSSVMGSALQPRLGYNLAITVIFL